MGTDITTIVYSQEAGDNNTLFGNFGNDLNDGSQPVFIGFDADNPQFVRISVEPDPSGVTSRVDVVTSVVVGIEHDGDDDDDGRIDGLMYGDDAVGFPHLMALFSNNVFDDDGNTVLDDNILVEVDLAEADLANVLTGIIGYAGLDLRGMSYDSVNEVGYATDATTGILYRIRTGLLVPSDDNEGLAILGNLSEVYTVYIASSTADTFITFTRFTIDDDGIE
ncbi:MAG: hypothetical protein IID32_11315, partial [Planctomycetes bacterium]|nr:hypothetical protein [Planctomycetota bacterium]